MRLKKQHAVDDDADGGFVVESDDPRTGGGLKMKKLHEQQLAATIHPETNCATIMSGNSISAVSPTNKSGFAGGGGCGGIKASEIRCSGGTDGEIIVAIESSHDADGDHHHRSNNNNGESAIITTTSSSPPGTVVVTIPGVPIENPIISTPATLATATAQV